MATKNFHKLSEKAIELTFYFLLGVLPFIFTPQMSELFEFPKMLLVYAGTVIIILAWTLKSILAGKIIFRRTILDLPLLLFLLAQSTSTFFSIDTHTSIWGYYSRFNGGLISIVCYTLLYWAYVSNLTIRHSLFAIRLLVASATIISVYAIFEHFGHSISCLVLKGNFDTSCWIPKVQERVFATLGQPNWLAAWLAMIAPLSWVYILHHPENSKKPQTLLKTTTHYLLPILLFAAILFTKSRSGLLGFIAADAVFLISLIKPFNKNALKSFCVLHFSFFVLILASGTPWTPSLSEGLGTLSVPPTKPNLESPTYPSPSASPGTESFDIRKIVWKGAIGVWRAYPILGSGVETFAYSYYNFRPKEANLTSEWDLLYNKAHNEYLNYLANTGTIGLLTYLFLIGTTIWLLLKKSYAFLPAYSSLLVTNFFGFSVVPTSLLFFLIPAMATTLGTRQKALSTSRPSLTYKKLPLLLLLFPIAYCLLPVISLYRADVLYAQSKKDNEKGLYQEAVKKLEKTLSLRKEPKYYDELADSTSQLAVNLYEPPQKRAEGEVLGRELAILTLKTSDEALKISPRHVTLWASRATYLKRLAGIDQSYLGLAVNSLEEAVRLAPTEPSFSYNLGVLYDYQGETEKARKILEKTVELKPNYNEARVGLAKIYIKLEEKQKAFEEVKYVLEKIDPRDEEARQLFDKLK
ncbi:MAG: hypothetical protein A3H88_02760 [Candidatus Blackburnbacteria bacterium RIFCSPLOWO2_02_FULL_44_9]|nr:MAG: hypothetical protein A3H88_02760 [Candidatus Blackburnbacteria bacterium RIFCSPLOWO2_02_FULL_44_9]